MQESIHSFGDQFEKSVYILGGALNLGADRSIRFISNPTCKGQRVGERAGGGAKADTLHVAAESNLDTTQNCNSVKTPEV